MKAPQGALGDARSVTLSVFDAAKGKCDANTGHIPAIPADEGTLTFELANTGCPSGVAWCKDISLDKDGLTKVFGVVAKNETGVIAEGCTTLEIDQDPLTVSIKVHLTNVEKCCGDSALQAGEQCEVPADSGQCGGVPETDICDATCQTKSIQLAIDSMAPPLTQGGAAKTELAMAFADGKEQLGGALRAVYTSASTDTTGDSDINLRALNKDLLPITAPFPYTHQLRIPILCADPGGAGSQREQRTPAIARVSDLRTAVVYASNEATATRYEVFLSAQTQDGCAEQKPFKISVGTAPGDDVGRPDVAGGPEGLALAVWPRGGKVKGRIWRAPVDGIGMGTLTPSDPEMELELAPNALNITDVRVAGWSGGWIIAYAGSGAGDDDGVFVNTISKDGNPGAEALVNVVTSGSQDQPDVAVLKSGAYAVAWRSDGDIYFQLYDANGGEIGDQLEPLNTKDPAAQQRPAVAAAGEIGEFFVAAWEDGADDIYARLIDGGPAGGFLKNSVTGQNDAFRVSYPGSNGVRRLPAIAAGGHIVIGWHDESVDAPGIYVRRFPLP